MNIIFKTLVAIFCFIMCYLLTGYSIKGNSEDDFIFTFFFAVFAFSFGVVFICDAIEQLIKKLRK